MNKKQKRKPRVYKVFSSSESEGEEKASKHVKLEDMSVQNILAQMKEKERKHEEFMAKNRNLIESAKLLKKRIEADEEKEKEYVRKRQRDDEERRNFVVKDCKGLSEAELFERFQRDSGWVDDVFYGRRYCQRHEMFKRENVKNRLTSKDLMYNVSCEVFTDDQLMYLCNLFRERFDAGQLWKYANYYWKVLLPEYCLKIFMDCYGLDHGEAMRYLNSIPVPIERYFKIIKDIDE